MMENKECPKCGSEIKSKDNNFYCNHCGLNFCSFGEK